MTRFTKTLVSAVLLATVATVAGCGTPAALERSQKLQLDAMVQYRDQMASYHEKVKGQLLADKQRELDTALAASLAQSADAEGRVPVATALEKARKRTALEEAFRGNLARLDGEFGQRQVAIGRAIDLAQGTLGLISDYSRLGALLRSLFVREIEGEQIIGTYEKEGSVTNAGSTSEPEASGR